MDRSITASAPQDRISSVSEGAKSLRHLDLCDGIDVISSCLFMKQTLLLAHCCKTCHMNDRLCKQLVRYSWY